MKMVDAPFIESHDDDDDDDFMCTLMPIWSQPRRPGHRGTGSWHVLYTLVWVAPGRCMQQQNAHYVLMTCFWGLLCPSFLYNEARKEGMLQFTLLEGTGWEQSSSFSLSADVT
jgi:hypothetical protein